jgi:hypothetical protein
MVTQEGYPANSSASIRSQNQNCLWYKSRISGFLDGSPLPPLRMGFQTEVDALVHYRHAYLLAASATMGSIFYGWDVGLIGGVITLPSFQTYFGVDKKNAAAKADFNGNIVSVLQAGCL